MPKRKVIPDDLFNAYIKAQIAADKANLEVAVIEKELRVLDKKGYEHPELRFDDNISYRPNWKQLVKEMAPIVYKTKGAVSMFFNKTLPKRFPKTEGVRKINILAERYEAHNEKLKIQKKKLGLIKDKDAE